MTIEIGGNNYPITKLNLRELRTARSFSDRASGPDVTIKEIDALTGEALEIIVQVLHRADAECSLTTSDLENCMTADDLSRVFLKLIEISMPGIRVN